MKTLTTNTLATVSGGASKSSEITTALKGVQDALTSQTNNKQSGFGSDGTTMLMLGLMMSKQNQGPTVVHAGAPAAPAAGPIVNISTRVRRGW